LTAGGGKREETDGGPQDRLRQKGLKEIEKKIKKVLPEAPHGTRNAIGAEKVEGGFWRGLQMEKRRWEKQGKWTQGLRTDYSIP